MDLLEVGKKFTFELKNNTAIKFFCKNHQGAKQKIHI